MAAEMKINEKFMVIYGNLRSPKAKIFVLGRRPLFTLFRLVLIKVFNYDI